VWKGVDPTVLQVGLGEPIESGGILPSHHGDMTAVFGPVPTDRGWMEPVRKEHRTDWTIQEAEELIRSLTGVISSRVVARPGGVVDEIHVLTTKAVNPKQTVRNVESALLAKLDISIDHRKISVAQTTDPLPAEPQHQSDATPVPDTEGAREHRILFQGHQLATESAHKLLHRVELEWQGETFTGEARAADLPRPRSEAVAEATLSAVEAAVRSTDDGAGTLTLDGVKIVSAFDRQFVLVSAHAIEGRNVRTLSGTAAVEGSLDRAVILASLQATDRWARGHV